MSQPTRQPGQHMAAEIAEQPDVFAALLESRPVIAAAAHRIARIKPRFVLLAARGSSDHAALYAKYLIEVLLKLPTGLVSPSTVTLYGAQPDLTDVLLLSVSQSGRSPDLVEFTATARKQQAMTVAVTNDPNSPLNDAADMSVDLLAGEEKSVAATKTYGASLLALYLLIDGIRGGNGQHAEPIPHLARATLDSGDVSDVAETFRELDQVVTTGRGFSSATAAEAALKLAETSYLAARAYSGADLLHGPVAAIDDGTAVLALCSEGKGGQAMRDVLEAVHRRGATICAIGSASQDTQATHRIGVPICMEELAPVLEVLPVQRLALELALARGEDPDHPRGLRKITRTR